MDKIIESITAILKLSSSLCDEAFVKMLLQRLESSYKYIVSEEDSWSIAFSVQKVENYIKNYCNIIVVPKELIETMIDMVIGDFLNTKNATGQLELEQLDLNGAIKNIKEGDTSIEFVQGLSDAEKFNKLLNGLMNEGDLLCYRRIKW